jgi:hypothetical protein
MTTKNKTSFSKISIYVCALLIGVNVSPLHASAHTLRVINTMQTTSDLIKENLEPSIKILIAKAEELSTIEPNIIRSSKEPNIFWYDKILKFFTNR